MSFEQEWALSFFPVLHCVLSFFNLLINQYQRFIQVQAYFNIQFQMFKNEIVDRNDKYRTDIRSQVHVSLLHQMYM